MRGTLYHMGETDIATQEMDRRAAEAFMPLVTVYTMTADVLRGRVDITTDSSGREQWILNPLETWHVGSSAGLRPAGEETDIILPPRSGQIRPAPENGAPLAAIHASYDVTGRIINSFVHRPDIHLDIEAARQIGHERASLQQALSDRGFQWKLNDQQTEDAYHIVRPDTPAAGSDGLLLHQTRIYTLAGVNGVRLMDGLVRGGADFAGAKVWTIRPHPGVQEFRTDTPIIMVNTVAQLASVIRMLREHIPYEKTFQTQVAGLQVDGLPGVFVGQTPGEGDSYHAHFAEFWADAITDAVRNGFPDFPSPKAGEEITPLYIQRVAEQARELARHRAKEQGLNPDHPALLADQDAAIVLDAIKLAA